MCCILLSFNAALGQSSNQIARGIPVGSYSLPDETDSRTQLFGARHVPRSVAGVKLGSVSLDPWTSPETEAAIYRALNSRNVAALTNVTIRKLAEYVGEQIPTYLDVSELDLLGVDPAHPIDGDTIPLGTLGGRLEIALEPLDLTFHIRGGCLQITSLDSAESHPQLRLYDVEPIVYRRKASDRTLATVEWDYSTLENTIVQHIEPDNWLQAGGMSAITPVVTNSRLHLMVSAPTRTQLQVSELLKTLIRSESHHRSSYASEQSSSQVISRHDTFRAAGRVPASKHPHVPGVNNLPRPHLQLRPAKVGGMF